MRVWLSELSSSDGTRFPKTLSTEGVELSNDMLQLIYDWKICWYLCISTFVHLCKMAKVAKVARRRCCRGKSSSDAAAVRVAVKLVIKSSQVFKLLNVFNCSSQSFKSFLLCSIYSSRCSVRVRNGVTDWSKMKFKSGPKFQNRA